MTGPEQVLVNVDALRHLKEVALDTPNYGAGVGRLQDAIRPVVDAIPEPEWEPTDDMVQKYDRAMPYNISRDGAIEQLKGLHREGLL